MKKIEETLVKYNNIKEKIEILEREKKECADILMASIPFGSKRVAIGSFWITLVEKETYSTSLSDAARFGAVTTKEVVNVELLKTLRKGGQDIPGVKVSSYIAVRLKTQETNDVQELLA